MTNQFVKPWFVFPPRAEDKAYVSEVLLEGFEEEWSEQEQEEKDEKSNSTVHSQQDQAIHRWVSHCHSPGDSFGVT